MHLTKLLETEYADRKPVWGWKDDTVEIMQKQIDYCADHGIAFWAFDWYYPEGKNKTTPLNNALGLYLKAPNCQRLKFCLLVANHAGFRIGPKDWDACCEKWIDLFRQPTHLRLDGQPLLIFFSPDELQRAFGGVEGVRKALDSLRAKAKKAGLAGRGRRRLHGAWRAPGRLGSLGLHAADRLQLQLGLDEWRRQPAVPKADRGQRADFRPVCREDAAPLRSGHHGRLGSSALGRRQAAAREDVGLVSRPHAQAGRGVRAAGRPLAGQASRQSHAPAAPADLRLERERRRRIPDADRQRRHRVPEGRAAGDQLGIAEHFTTPENPTAMVDDINPYQSPLTDTLAARPRTVLLGKWWVLFVGAILGCMSFIAAIAPMSGSEIPPGHDPMLANNLGFLFPPLVGLWVGCTRRSWRVAIHE